MNTRLGGRDLNSNLSFAISSQVMGEDTWVKYLPL